jgi:dTDP-4-amino-4,6-dideoxygalactose transaminase
MINVTKTYLPDRRKFDSYIDRIYESAWLTNHGPLYQELELRLKEYLGVRNIVLVSNGTLALQVAIKSLGLTGNVITSPFSFIATASSIAWEGLTPLFADIDKETWNLDPDKIEEAIDANTSAILPVHVFGNACKVKEIDAIAKQFNLKTIYDGAHAFGVNFMGESLLNWGDISILSFHSTKLFHTIEGGAIVTNDDDLADKIRKLTNFGFSNRYSFSEVGINTKMNEFQAAMGLCVLDEIDVILKKRKEIFDYYSTELEGLVKFQKTEPNCSQSYSYFPVLFPTIELMENAENVLNENQIFPRRYFFPSLDTLDIFKSCKEQKNSREIAGRILCLPIYPGLNGVTIEKIVSILRSVLG